MMRDFLYIEDVVELYIRIAESLSADKKKYMEKNYQSWNPNND